MAGKLTNPSNFNLQGVFMNTVEELNEVTKDKLVADLKVVVADAEELLKATANQAGEKLTVVRARIEESLKTAKVNLAKAQDVVVDKTKVAAKVTDDYVKANPWKAVGIAAGVGFVLGLLVGRR